MIVFWDWHWLSIVGTVMAIIGVLFSAANYLDRRYIFLKGLSQGFISGILVALIYILCYSLMQSILLAFVHFILLQTFGPSNLQTISSDPNSLSGFSFILPQGMIFGFPVGFVYSILRFYKADFNKIFFFKIEIACLLILSAGLLSEQATAYIFYEQIPGWVDYLLGNFVGLIFGFVIAQVKSTRWKVSLLWILGIDILALFLFSLRLLNISSVNNFIFYLYLKPVFIGFLFGITIDHSQQLYRVVKIIPKKKFVLNVLKGFLLSIIIFVVFFLLFVHQRIDFSIDNDIFFAFFSLVIFLSQGDLVIKNIKQKYRYLRLQNVIEPLINWKRLFYCLLIFFLYGLLYFIYSFISIQLYILFPNTIQKYAYVQIFISIMMEYMAVGLIIGCIYGLGPFFLYKIENLSEIMIGRIGIILTILGIIVATLLH